MTTSKHIFPLAHSTKAAIAPRTNGAPVNAALTAPPALKEVFNDVDSATVVVGATVVDGVVGVTPDATIGVETALTDTIADLATEVAMTADEVRDSVCVRE